MMHARYQVEVEDSKGCYSVRPTFQTSAETKQFIIPLAENMYFLCVISDIDLFSNDPQSLFGRIERDHRGQILFLLTTEAQSYPVE